MGLHHAWTALRRPRPSDPEVVADVLAALWAVGPDATAQEVAAHAHRGLQGVRAALVALDGTGAVALGQRAVPARRPLGRPAKARDAVLEDALEALKTARAALTRAERAVKRALEKPVAPQGAHP